MDIFFCLPILFGCDGKVKQEGDGTAYVCPRCHNASVVTCKSRKVFSVCFIPLIPMKAKHIYQCGICQWAVDQDSSYKPQRAGAPPGGGQMMGGGYPPQGQGGYGGGYPNK
ncbi:hypothetical protein BCV69DRAFT_283291 [Microstroma glucosiphilum]|uniref:Zinc-ribbon 15 domain-containing protein n=1 Tax=Pseudomicrostroma glucosiphilum TaxID=1684307 RepID=A0A316U7T1_9BASI|nr:hypothetical protein BCV69DRAFT_283291 [Pseudomicrostroma glucosiphilum]PWN20413.1 hypothetical protein BCV69DRAFT_283291 [Pseudomicrostroma glucosiphilum]